MRFDDVAGNGLGRCCPLRDGMPFKSRHEGSECVLPTSRTSQDAINIKK